MVSIFEWPQQHEKLEELKSLGAHFVYRRRFYPAFFTRLYKKLINLFFKEGKKITYHQYLEKFKPDHIFFNLAGGDEIAADSSDLMVFVKQTKIPFSVFYHSLSLENYFTKELAENFKFVLQKSNYSFFTSNMQINLLETHLNYQIRNAYIMNHPLRELYCSPLPSEKDGLVRFCIIGSLTTRWKGQDVVLSILAKEKWRKRKWQLNIYGDGPDKENLIKIVKESGLSERVKFHGHNERIEDIFQSNDLVLIPSKQDSGPIVLFEAMLAARPVVGTYMGAMPEYIDTNQTGVLSKSIKGSDFENALEEAWSNRGKWGKWGVAGRNKILASYDFEPEKTLLEKLFTTSNQNDQE